ncbi:MAG: redoxin domain-containing protein [Acidobacteria bacterium]|nr:redoxin domain-containing protein [Acidobacteriota bacterium]
MKRVAILFTFLFALAVAANAQGLAVGGTIENFSLSNIDGKTVSLNELKGKNGAVIMFVSSQCPVVKLYNERMNQIAADYAAKGIAFIGINSNATEMDKAAAKPLDWGRAHITETYKFPVLFDKGNVLADKLGASVTPEAYYLDANNVLLYHGAIDNDRSGENITETYLRTAFDTSLAGKKIERVKANAFGCTIKRAVAADTK